MNGRVRNVLPSSRGRRAKAAAVGAMDKTYTRYWLDRVPITNTLRGNWSYAGDSVQGLPPRESTR